MSTRYSQSSNRDHSFIHKKVLSIYYEPGKVAGTKDATVNKQTWPLPSRRARLDTGDRFIIGS